MNTLNGYLVREIDPGIVIYKPRFCRFLFPKIKLRGYKHISIGCQGDGGGTNSHIVCACAYAMSYFHFPSHKVLTRTRL